MNSVTYYQHYQMNVEFIISMIHRNQEVIGLHTVSEVITGITSVPMVVIRVRS